MSHETTTTDDTDGELDDCEAFCEPPNPGRYTVRDRKKDREYHLCGPCLGKITGYDPEDRA